MTISEYRSSLSILSLKTSLVPANAVVAGVWLLLGLTLFAVLAVTGVADIVALQPNY